MVYTGEYMKVIHLTQNKVTWLDNEDFERVNKYKWHANKKTTGVFYAYRKQWIPEKQKYITIIMHRFIMNCPEDMEIDHIDHNGLNNQKSNLKICSHADNMRNIKVRRTSNSGFRGISWDKKNKKWRITICKEKKFYNRGRFTELEDAVKEHRKSFKEIFGYYP